MANQQAKEPVIPPTETVSETSNCTVIHAQYWSVIAATFVNINIYDLPEPGMAAARRAIKNYRKGYPAGTTEFRIMVESVRRKTIDIDYP